MTNSYDLAASIHGAVNRDIKYCTDISQYNTLENWTLPNTGLGDCEDYALLKRELLLRAGFARKDLHLACCWCETGQYHAVLLCNTSKGWLVLDNRYTWPMSPKSLPYHWDKALDEVDGKWYELSF